MAYPGMLSNPSPYAPQSGGGMLGGGGDNWFGRNRMLLATLGSNLMSPGGFSNAGANLPQAMMADRSERDRKKKQNATLAWLRTQNLSPEAMTAAEENPEVATQLFIQSVMPKERKIRDDANSVPRYEDTGEPVFKTDSSAQEGMFSGKSVSGQGLNFLVQSGALTKAQAAQIAAGKLVVGADGSSYYMKPEDLVGASPNGQLPPGTGAPGTPPGVVGAAPGVAATAGQGGTRLTTPKTFGDDTETKAAGFASRMQNSNAIIDEKETAGTSLPDKLKSGVPVVGNYMISDEYRQLDQAKRDFINAQLRRESGAVIAESEFDNAEKQYFPQPGDDPKTIAQKKVNRALAIKAMERSAGPLNQNAVEPPAAGEPVYTSPSGVKVFAE